MAAVVEAAKAAPFPDPEAPVTEFKHPRPHPHRARNRQEGYPVGLSEIGLPRRRSARRSTRSWSATSASIFFGEDVAVAGGVFAVTPGCYEKHGAERVFDTPISELALAGAAFGSAVSGPAAR